MVQNYSFSTLVVKLLTRLPQLPTHKASLPSSFHPPYQLAAAVPFSQVFEYSSLTPSQLQLPKVAWKHFALAFLLFK